MSAWTCRGPVRFVVVIIVILWLVFLGHLLSSGEKGASFDISKIPSQVLVRLQSVLNRTRLGVGPEKFPIIWSHRDPSFSRLDEDSIIHVQLTTRSTTLGGAVAAVNSIHLNTRHPVRFHIFVDDSDDSVQHLANWMSQTHLRDVDYEVIPFNTSLLAGRIVSSSSPHPMDLARFYTPPILLARSPGARRWRLVHVDDDILVQGDIFDLWNRTFDDKRWSAFSNECTGKPKHSLHQHIMSAFVNFKHPAIRRLKIPPATCAINAGVYVVDLDSWSKRNVTGKLDQWLSLNFAAKGDLFNHQREFSPAAPPLMLLFHDKYVEINPMWHVRGLGEPAGERYSHRFLEKARLLHWSGVNKPWGIIDEAMGRSIWDTYYVHDPWNVFKVVRQSQHKSARHDS